MSQILSPDTQREADPTPLPSMRRRLLALAAACVAGGLFLAAGTALHRARLEQQVIEDAALNVARSTVHAADREIAASLARLQALATSPALQFGDLRTFYDQLMATPLPEGTWFVLYDRERQILNTLRPFGAPLPRIDQFGPGSQAAMRRAFERGDVIISPVVWGVTAQTHLVSVTIPVAVNGEIAHIFDNILSDRRITEVIEELRMPSSWRSTLVDRNQATIAYASMTRRPGGRAVPAAWTDDLRGPANEGIFPGQRDDASLLVAFARSPVSNWTAVVEVPWTPSTIPVQRTARMLAIGGGALAALAVALAFLVARGADKPIQALRTSEARARARQREAETRYRTYWQHTGEGLFVLAATEDGFLFEGLNPALVQLSGLHPEQVVGHQPQECLPAKVAAVLASQCRRCLDSGVVVQFGGSFDLPSGLRDLETSIAPVRDPGGGRIIRLLGTVRDITERRQSEAALRSLGGRILTLQDDERRRLARELHDSTAQTLLGASFAVARVKSASATLSPAAEDACQEALSLIEEAQREIRTLAYLLHPPLLEEMGLPAALRGYAKGLSHRSRLNVVLDIDPSLADRRFPREVESALFRVAQEALANAQRHSGADTVSVGLSECASGAAQMPGAIMLSVHDNGRGIPQLDATSGGDALDPSAYGVGLLGMRERVRQLGGTLRIRSAQPRGTVVEALVPPGTLDLAAPRALRSDAAA